MISMISKEVYTSTKMLKYTQWLRESREELAWLAGIFPGLKLHSVYAECKTKTQEEVNSTFLELNKKLNEELPEEEPQD